MRIPKQSPNVDRNLSVPVSNNGNVAPSFAIPWGLLGKAAQGAIGGLLG